MPLLERVWYAAAKTFKKESVMKRSLKMAVLLFSFTLAASMAHATNFSKSDKNKPSPAAPAESPVMIEVSAGPKVLPKPETAPKSVSSVVVQSSVKIKPAAVVQPPVKVEPVVKVAPPVKAEPSVKPAPSDKPLEIQTFDRTMLVCPDGHACVKTEAEDYKCVPDKTKSVGGYGETCKTTPRPIATPEPAQAKRKP